MEDKYAIILSELPHTWLIDIDGTLVMHNGYTDRGENVLLENTLTFLNEIPERNMVILLTSRIKESRELTEAFLSHHNI